MSRQGRLQVTFAGLSWPPLPSLMVALVYLQCELIKTLHSPNEREHHFGTGQSCHGQSERIGAEDWDEREGETC